MLPANDSSPQSCTPIDHISHIVISVHQIRSRITRLVSRRTIKILSALTCILSKTSARVGTDPRKGYIYICFYRSPHTKAPDLAVRDDEYAWQHKCVSPDRRRAMQGMRRRRRDSVFGRRVQSGLTHATDVGFFPKYTY